MHHAPRTTNIRPLLHHDQTLPHCLVEILYHLRQWAFYLTAIGLPLLFAAAGAMPRLQSFSQQTFLASVGWSSTSRKL
ncbi:MAG: hypothetical protein U0401_13400 [Anaerolineae bacterium]